MNYLHVELFIYTLTLLLSIRGCHSWPLPRSLGCRVCTENGAATLTLASDVKFRKKANSGLAGLTAKKVDIGGDNDTSDGFSETAAWYNIGVSNSSDTATREDCDTDDDLFRTPHEWEAYLVRSSPPPRKKEIRSSSLEKQDIKVKDPFWEQIRLDAKTALHEQASSAGPQLFQGILSHRSLLKAVCTVISHEIENDLIGATEIRDLFLDLLKPEDEYAIRLDLQAAATRSPSIENAMEVLMFHKGFHSLVCYRVAHRLWLAGRTGLAYYMQSMISRVYSSDIHPACRMGYGLFLRGAGSGIVIGETATVGNDVSILEGVTLGGTGKEAGDRHPKVGNGVILQEGASILGNIPVGDGSIVTARSIVTKPVPPLAIVTGVPAKVVGSRDVLVDINKEFAENDLYEHLMYKYLSEWQVAAKEQRSMK